MHGWFEFYSAVGGFAATLLGLLFVAISINAAAVLGDGHENSKRLAEQAFQNYLAVMMVALLAIFPTLEIATFAGWNKPMTSEWFPKIKQRFEERFGQGAISADTFKL